MNYYLNTYLNLTEKLRPGKGRLNSLIICVSVRLLIFPIMK